MISTGRADRSVGLCLLIAANLLFAGQGVAVKWLDASLNPVAIALLPFYCAILIGAAFLFSTQGKRSRWRLAVLLTPLASTAKVSPAFYPFAGNLMIAAGCFGSAFYNVYSKRLLDRFTDLEVLFFSYLATAVAGVPVLLACDRQWIGQVAHLDLRGWIALGYLTIFLYGLAMVFFLRALRSVDAIVAAASLYLIPIFGVALAAVLLGERLQFAGVAGSGVVLAATFLLFRLDRNVKIP